MNILFLYSSMNPLNGGIERVTSILFEKFREDGNNVFCIGMRRDFLEYEESMIYLPNKIKENSVENVNFVDSFISANKIKHVIAQIAGPNDTSNLLMSLKSKVQKIVCIHLDILDSKRHYGTSRSTILQKYHLGGLINFLDSKFMGVCLSYLYTFLKRSRYRELHRKCDKVVLLSRSFIEDYEFVVGEKNISNLISIPNPLPKFDIKELDKNSARKKTVLYVGRINSSQKKVDYLLKIWNKIYSKHPDWTLKIVGGGEDLESLMLMAKDMNLKQYSFEGFQNPVPYYQEAAIFCMTSSFEGFGMVLIEAMRFGVVPIAFNSYMSVYDIIDHGNNGMLVNGFDLDKYAATISSLITDNDKRLEMSEEAMQASKKFEIDNVSKIWYELFNEN